MSNPKEPDSVKIIAKCNSGISRKLGLVDLSIFLLNNILTEQ